MSNSERKHVEILEFHRSAFKVIQSRLDNNFPIRSNFVVMALIFFFSIGLCLLSSYMVMMSYLKGHAYAGINAKFEFKNETNLTFFDEFEKFNGLLYYFGQYSRNRIMVLVMVSVVTLVVGIFSVIFRCLIVFVVSMLVALVCGTLTLWFGYSIFTYDLSNGQRMFAFLLVKYNSGYDCYYNQEQIEKCKSNFNVLSQNYSGQVARNFNKWGCCGYSSWHDFKGDSVLRTIPLFCCPFTKSTTTDKFIVPHQCLHKDMFPVCEKIFYQEVHGITTSQDFRIVTISLGITLIIMFCIALFHLILLSHKSDPKPPISTNAPQELKSSLKNSGQYSPNITPTPDTDNQRSSVKSTGSKKSSIRSTGSRGTKKSSIKSTGSRQNKKSSIRSNGPIKNQKSSIRSTGSKQTKKTSLRNTGSKPLNRLSYKNVENL